MCCAGVAYIMDTVLGNCTVTPISKLSSDATAADSVHVRMKNEREFFSFNNKFTYAGQVSGRPRIEQTECSKSFLFGLL